MDTEKKVGLFDANYGTDPSEYSEERKSLAKQNVMSGFDSAIRSEKEKVLDLKVEQNSVIHAIANGEKAKIKRLAEIDLLIEDGEALIDKMTKRQGDFFPES